MNSHETWTESVGATVILVTGRLINAPFASKLSIQGLNRDTIRMRIAVAATFTHLIIDEHALGRIRELISFPPPTFLCRTGLVINNCGDAGLLTELKLQAFKLPSVMNFYHGRPVYLIWIFIWLVSHNGNTLDTLGP